MESSVQQKNHFSWPGFAEIFTPHIQIREFCVTYCFNKYNYLYENVVRIIIMVQKY